MGVCVGRGLGRENLYVVRGITSLPSVSFPSVNL